MNAIPATAGSRATARPHVSIGIIAWNEEKVIGATLNSLFQQSLFADLESRGLTCEILCLANACTDRTAEVVRNCFAEQQRCHPHARAFRGQVIEVAERGKNNSWNLFVHSCSAREARYLFLMDADILIHERDSMRSMLRTLELSDRPHVAVDEPCKDVEFKPRLAARERLSLGASQLTRSGSAQLCGQLYCIRAEVARNIHLPRDLNACEDGFIKALVCTDFLQHEVWPDRIQLAPGAAHTFEAYTSFSSILRNQKRQAIGQTIVHILVDKFLPTLSASDRRRLPETLRAKEQNDSAWLKRLIAEHLQSTRRFWRLYPDAISLRFRRLRKLPWWKRMVCLPSALAASCMTLLACWLAYRSLKQGSTDYWPRAERVGFDQFPFAREGATSLRRANAPK